MSEGRSGGDPGVSDPAVGAWGVLGRSRTWDDAEAEPLSAALTRYAVAVLAVAVAILAARICAAFLHAEPYVSLFLCAIMASAWFGGFGPGLLATALAVLGFHHYLLSPAPFVIAADEAPRLALFLVTALFVTWLSATQRGVARSLRQSRRRLIAALDEQKRVEAKLRRGEIYLAEAQRLSRTGSFGWKIDTGEVAWSAETFRIFQYDPAVTPTLHLAMARVHPDDRAQVQRRIDRASIARRDFDFEFRLAMPDGAVKHVRAIAHAGGEEAGAFEFVGAVMDMTETIRGRQAAAALSVAQADLAHAARVIALGELTTSIAHEVNQPLTAILSNAEAGLRWLDRGADHLGSARRSVEWIIKDVNRAAAVIDRVRTLARKSGTARTVFDIGELVTEVGALLRRELADNGVQLAVAIPADALTVLADRVQLQQVIMNLLMNGIEAMQSVADRPRELSVSCRRDQAGDVAVAVEDCGVGFTAEDADRLFNAFFTTKSSGLGLGLSICRSIVESHDGRLSAFRGSASGSTFQFTLPFHQAV